MAGFESEYKWVTPYHWLNDKLVTWDRARLMQELSIVAAKLDYETIQELYQSEMDDDGYFDKVVPS